MTEPVIAYAVRICNKFHSDVIMFTQRPFMYLLVTSYRTGTTSRSISPCCAWRWQPAESNSYVAEHLSTNEIFPH